MQLALQMCGKTPATPFSACEIADFICKFCTSSENYSNYLRATSAALATSPCCLPFVLPWIGYKQNTFPLAKQVGSLGRLTAHRWEGGKSLLLAGNGNGEEEEAEGSRVNVANAGPSISQNAEMARWQNGKMGSWLVIRVILLNN